MYQDPLIIRNRRIAIIFGGLFGILILAGIIAGIVNLIKSNQEMLSIRGFSDCATGISGDDERKASKNFYAYVKAQLELDGANEISSHYDASVRADSCKVTEFADKEGNLGYNASFILDITELGYAYQANLSYVKAGDPALVDMDLGTPVLSCLSDAEFNCLENPLIKLLGAAASSSSIDTLFPYSDGKNFLVQLIATTNSKSGYGLVITYIPSSTVYMTGDTENFRAKYRATIDKYLADHNIKAEEYQIIEKWK